MNGVTSHTVVLPEATLLLGKKTLQLKGPHEVSIDHPLHCFTQTAGKPEVAGFRVVFTGFRNGNDYCFMP